MRGGRRTAADARARVAGWPCWPRHDRFTAVLAFGRRSALFEPSCSSEATPSGSELALRGLAATLRPDRAVVAALVDARVPLWRYVVVLNLFAHIGDYISRNITRYV